MTGKPDSIKVFVARLHGIFRSVRLTAWVLGLLIFLYFIGLVTPQQWMFDSRKQYEAWVTEGLLNRILDLLGITNVYLSPITIALLGVFFLNLLVVTVHRVPVMLRKAYLSGSPPSVQATTLRASPGVLTLFSARTAGETGRKIRDFFSKRRWYLIDTGENAFVAVKNRLSPLGFLLFHLSFFFCLAGGLLLAYTRFSGNLVLTEGQDFRSDIRQFRRIEKDPKIFKELPAIELLIEKVQPRYERDVPTELEVVLRVRYKGEEVTELLKVNEPIQRGAMSIIVEDVGVSPLFEVLGPSGQFVDGAFVTLDVLNGKEDRFQFDTDRRFSFRVLFYPDYALEDGREISRSIELRNPAVHVIAEREGIPVFEGTLKPGQCGDLQPFSLCFRDVRYWADLHMAREYGRFPLIVGFGLALLGLVMRLVFYQKRVRMAFANENGRTVVYMDGKSEYFPHAFGEETRVLSELLEKELEGGVTDR